MAAERISAVGLAMSLPAISGALPCVGSKIATSAPMLAPGAMPRPPTRPAHRSLTMSPYRFRHTSTSKSCGSCTRPMQVASTILSLNSISGYRSATSRAMRRYRPSVAFMMLALCTHVTFLRPQRRAYSNAYSTIRRDRAMEIGLIEMAESAANGFWPDASTNLFSSTTSGEPSSNSMPAYRSSVFSRTITRSMSRYREPSPGCDRQGRTQAYRSNSLRRATLTLRKPVPTGVVMGPLMATLVARTASSTCSGRGVPYSPITPAPASCTFQLIWTPVASTTRRMALVISGPMPSPGISTTSWVMAYSSSSSSASLFLARTRFWGLSNLKRLTSAS